MVTTAIFPGQGSQKVGMGRDLADAFPESARVFEEVDDALGEKLSEVIWEGPEDRLTLTANAQPALMAVSMAALKALEVRGLEPAKAFAYVAGHSLGEYSALCAAGVVSLADTARLLRIRGDAMQAAVPVGEGAMAAIIGLEPEAVEAICEEVAEIGSCQIANDNGGGQWVISGAAKAVEAAISAASGRGAKRALPLPVSAPFHSALMAPAAEAMRQALGEVEFRSPAMPVIANVVAAPVSDPAELKRLLVEQVTGRVRWRESVVWMAENGVASAVEIGAGKVLSGLNRRIAKDIAGLAVGAPGDIDTVIEAMA